MKDFFRQSDLLDALALRQLSHINGNWELTWDEESGQYEPEEESFAEKVNELIVGLESVNPWLHRRVITTTRIDLRSMSRRTSA